MTMHIQSDGPGVTRDQLGQICAILGYNPADVREIHISGTGPVLVDVFLRQPWPGSERGVRFSDDEYVDGRRYTVARITHPIVSPKPDNEDEHPEPLISDERLALIEEMTRRGTKLARVEVLELTDAIRRLKESL